MIEHVEVIKDGETPWGFQNNPGYLPGPWGDSVEEALERLDYEAGLDIVDWWEDGNTLWVSIKKDE